MKTRQCAVVFPCRELRGRLSVPGDKSISQRAALLAALCRGTSRLHGFLHSQDCLNTLQAVAGLGVSVRHEADVIAVTGQPWTAPAGPLDLGNSGTGLRLLAGLLAGRPWTTELTGDASLRSRPMQRIQEPLQALGAAVELLGAGGCAPVRITGGALRAIDYRLPVASAQVKSCVLLAALFAAGETVVEEPLPTRDHTERALLSLGADLSIAGPRISLHGYGAAGPDWTARDWHIPGDFSSAAFWLVAGVLGGQQIVLDNVGLNPRRTALLNVLERMGAPVIQFPVKTASTAEPVGRLEASRAQLRGTVIGGEEIPNLIDELPVLAVAGVLAEGVTEIRDARELRVKESDRIAAMASNLRRLGVALEEREDGLSIQGPNDLAGGVQVDACGDHRIAMALAILGLHARAPVRICGIDCINASYPNFWRDLKQLGAHVEIGCSH